MFILRIQYLSTLILPNLQQIQISNHRIQHPILIKMHPPNRLFRNITHHTLHPRPQIQHYQSPHRCPIRHKVLWNRQRCNRIPKTRLGKKLKSGHLVIKICLITFTPRLVARIGSRWTPLGQTGRRRFPERTGSGWGAPGVLWARGSLVLSDAACTQFHGLWCGCAHELWGCWIMWSASYSLGGDISTAFRPYVCVGAFLGWNRAKSACRRIRMGRVFHLCVLGSAFAAYCCPKIFYRSLLQCKYISDLHECSNAFLVNWGHRTPSRIR